MISPVLGMMGSFTLLNSGVCYICDVKRLLYVEDNPVTQKMVKRKLDGVAEISTATTLADARLMLRKQTFDLLLADVNLPDGNTLDLVVELRTRYSAIELPVILVSAAMHQRLKVRALQSGANDCFPMPTPWVVLVKAVRQMLDHPYVRPNDLGVVAVTWVEGVCDNRPWVYCPELNLRLDGESSEALRKAMTQRVQSAAAVGVGLPFVSRVKVTECMVEVGPR